MKEQTIYPTDGGREIIQNFTLLGNAIGFKPKYMAYARNNRNMLVHRKEISGRVVYCPSGPLRRIQRAVGKMLSYAFDATAGNGAAIAYRKGMDVRKLLRNMCVGCKVLVKTDIVKYYDHVTRGKIKESLKDVGFLEHGPGVVASYLVVKREIPLDDGKSYKLETLQQGSSASPAMSNIVGRKFFDSAINKWLEENCEVPYRYYRYSDNIALFLLKDPGQEWIEGYKKMVRGVAAENKFRTHAWASIRPTNVSRPQEFLGVILNQKANVPRSLRDRLFSVMYSALRSGITDCARWWCKKREIGDEAMSDAELRSLFAYSMIGYAAYVVNVNERYGYRMMKMARLIERCASTGKNVKPGAVWMISRYRNDGETVRGYLDRFADALA